MATALLNTSARRNVSAMATSVMGTTTYVLDETACFDVKLTHRSIGQRGAKCATRFVGALRKRDAARRSCHRSHRHTPKLRYKLGAVYARCRGSSRRGLGRSTGRLHLRERRPDRISFYQALHHHCNGLAIDTGAPPSRQPVFSRWLPCRRRLHQANKKRAASFVELARRRPPSTGTPHDPNRLWLLKRREPI